MAWSSFCSPIFKKHNMSHVVFNDPYNKCPGSKIITDLTKHTYKRKKNN